MSPVSKQIFADSYYQNDSLLFQSKIHTCINEGIVTSLNCKTSFLNRVKKWFCFQQDKDLLEVNQRLHALFTNLSSQESNDFKVLSNELHAKSYSAYEILKSNLTTLNRKFERANKKSIFITISLRIINAVRIVFGNQKIILKNYHSIPNEQLISKLQAVSQDAYKLTEVEKKNAAYTIKVIGDKVPEELTTENVQRLEFGLLDSICFDEVDSFSLSYKVTTKMFNLTIKKIASETRSEMKALGDAEIDPFNPPRSIILNPQRGVKLIDHIIPWDPPQSAIIQDTVDESIIHINHNGKESVATFWVKHERNGRWLEKNSSKRTCSKPLVLIPGAEYTFLSPKKAPLKFVISKKHNI